MPIPSTRQHQRRATRKSVKSTGHKRSLRKESYGLITVGINGGEVRDWAEQKRRFEVMVRKSPRACKRDDEADTPSSKGFGVVQSYETKPQRRLFEVLQSQGHQMH